MSKGTASLLPRLMRNTSQLFSSRFASYFVGNAGAEEIPLGSLETNSTAQAEKPGKAPTLRVLARRCYRERTETFPIKARKELEKLLEQRQKPGQMLLHFIGPYENNRRVVQEVEVLPQYIETLRSTRVLIPETQLLAVLAPKGLLEIKNPQGSLYFSNSSEGFNSALSGGVIQNPEAAKMALGLSSNAEVTVWQQEQYLALLADSLHKLPSRHWKAVVQSRQQRGEPLPWPQMGIAAGAVLVVYALFSSLYLNWTDSSRESRLANFGDAVSERLAQRSSAEQEANRLNALAQVSPDMDKFSASWEVIALLYQEEVTINSLRGDFERIELTAEARSATDVVQMLSELDLVTNVEFTSPVRRGRQGSGEVFSVNVDVQPVAREQQQEELAQAERENAEDADNGE